MKTWVDKIHYWAPCLWRQISCGTPFSSAPWAETKLQIGWTTDPIRYSGSYLPDHQSPIDVMDISSFSQKTKLVVTHWAGVRKLAEPSFIHESLRLCVCVSLKSKRANHISVLGDSVKEKSDQQGRLVSLTVTENPPWCLGFSLSSRCFLSGRHSQ